MGGVVFPNFIGSTRGCPVEFNDKNKCVRLISVQDEYKQMLEYMNRLY